MLAACRYKLCPPFAIVCFGMGLMGNGIQRFQARLRTRILAGRGIRPQIRLKLNLKDHNWRLIWLGEFDMLVE